MYTDKLIVAKETVPAATVFQISTFRFQLSYLASFTKITYTGKWSL